MDDVVTDPSDLLKQVDTVSRSQRALFGEFERQRSRLDQLVRWYDHQQTARRSELRRQSEQIYKESQRRIFYRSSIAVTERARLQHLLDNENDKNNLLSCYGSEYLIRVKNPEVDKKRQVYGCMLPHLKAPLKTTTDNEKPMTSKHKSRQSRYQNYLEHQRHSIRKSVLPPVEQQNKMKNLLEKFSYDLEECNGDGYDHFLQTSEPNRNAQILARQNTNHKI